MSIVSKKAIWRVWPLKFIFCLKRGSVTLLSTVKNRRFVLYAVSRRLDYHQSRGASVVVGFTLDPDL